MKIRTLIAAFSLIVAVPVMQAADTSAEVTASVAAQVKANPGNAAQIVADAIKANPALAPDIAAAALKAAPGQARAITTAAMKAAPNQIAAIAKAETKAVPAQSTNIYSAAVSVAASTVTSGGMSGSAYSATINSLVDTYIAGITGKADTLVGEKINATVVSGSS